MKTNIILCYHRIAPPKGGGQSKLAVSEVHFVSQLKVIRKFFKFVSLSEIRNSSRSVAVTFDDGYLDNLVTAIPRLEELKIPATFFIPTSNLQSGLLQIVDLVDIGFSSTANRDLLFSTLREIRIVFAERDATYWGVLDCLYKLPSLKFKEALESLNKTSLASEVIRSDPFRRPMNLEDLKTIEKMGGFEIGSHSESHRKLSEIPPAEMHREIIDSINFLKSNFSTDSLSTCFAIPFGQTEDFNPEVLDVLEREGLIPLTTHPFGINSNSRYRGLPRLCVQNWSPMKLLVLIQLCRIASFMPDLWLRALELRRVLTKRII